MLRTIANEYPEVHSLVHAEESGTEYFYAVVQKGTPRENWLFVKMKTDGTVVWRSLKGQLQASGGAYDREQFIKG